MFRVHEIFYACYLWPWLSPLLTVLYGLVCGVWRGIRPGYVSLRETMQTGGASALQFHSSLYCLLRTDIT